MTKTILFSGKHDNMFLQWIAVLADYMHNGALTVTPCHMPIEQFQYKPALSKENDVLLLLWINWWLNGDNDVESIF